MQGRWMTAALALLPVALAGCGGDDGGAGPLVEAASGAARAGQGDAGVAIRDHRLVRVER